MFFLCSGFLGTSIPAKLLPGIGVWILILSTSKYIVKFDSTLFITLTFTPGLTLIKNCVTVGPKIYLTTSAPIFASLNVRLIISACLVASSSSPVLDLLSFDKNSNLFSVLCSL